MIGLNQLVDEIYCHQYTDIGPFQALTSFIEGLIFLIAGICAEDINPDKD